MRVTLVTAALHTLTHTQWTGWVAASSDRCYSSVLSQAARSLFHCRSSVSLRSRHSVPQQPLIVVAPCWQTLTRRLRSSYYQRVHC